MENLHFQNLTEKLRLLFFHVDPSVDEFSVYTVVVALLSVYAADSQNRKKEIYKAAKRKSCCSAMAKRVLPPPAQICSLNNKSDFKNLIFLSHVISKLTLIVLAIVAQDYIVLYLEKKKKFQLQYVCVRFFFWR